MKNGTVNIGKYTKLDIIKANRKASRDESIELNTGWVAVSKSHKSIKDYKRNPKHKKDYLSK